MKKLVLFLLILPFSLLAQVGVNTTTPNAMLDVTSTTNGILIPRVQLTSITDILSVVNPNGGPLATSTLVYNISAAGVVPNNVVAGFYYWNGSQWITIGGSAANNWSLIGNAATNPPSTIDFPIAATENFIGTTDYEDVVFGANNMSRMKISAFGNIGIGTNNPNAKFHVNDFNSPYITSWITKTNLSGGFGGSGYVSPTLVVNTTSTNGGTSELYYNAQFSAGGVHGATNIGASFAAGGGANNYAIIVPENSGLVGIGTATPTTTLHVENTTAGAIRIVDGTQAAGRVLTSDATGVATWQNSATTAQAWFLNGNSTITTPTVPVTYGASTIGATENYMGTTNANDVVFGTNNIERMRILSTGNVGIGLANAPAKLSVSGSFLSPTFPNATTNAMLRIGNNTEGLDIGKAGVANNYASWLQSGFNGNADPLSLQPLGGNVGVGTTNPTSNLEIESDGVTELKLSSRAAFGASRFSMYSDKTLATEWRPAYIESADNGIFTGRLDFYTNGTGIANRLGSLRAMSIANGNVGIGTVAPNLARLQVDGMIGNTTAIFRGNSTTSLGISMVADWPGIYFNSYYNGAIRSMGGAGFASIINTDQNNGSLYFQTTNVTNPASGAAIASIPIRMTVAGNGNVGVGATTPTNLLHVNSATAGAVRIVDGTQAAGRVLTSNATGVATWQAPTGGTSDHDWYEEGTTNPPNAITDNIFHTGNVGIGTTTPSNLLHVNSTTSGAVRIVDGTQANNRVLTSNATGVATWQPVGISNVTGVLSATGASIPYNLTSYVQTGSTITLPPGRYAVNVTMLLARNTTIFASPNNSFFWVRSTFSDTSGIFPAPSPDIQGSTLASGNFGGSSIYAMLIGTIIINNTSGANKTYYYVGGNTANNSGTTETLTNFGSSYWAEDSIIAYRLN